MKPYVKEAKKIVPKLKKVISIKHRTPRVDQIQRCQALITEFTEGKKKSYFTITIWTEYLESEKAGSTKMTKRPYSKLDIVSHLAHEVAHLVDFDHTPEHKKVEAQLTKIFAKMLEKEGYISEEQELKESSHGEKKSK